MTQEKCITKKIVYISILGSVFMVRCSNISFMPKRQTTNHPQFWHLTFFQNDTRSHLTGKNTKIAILDHFLFAKNTNGNNCVKNGLNLENRQSFCFFDKNIEAQEDLSLYRTKKLTNFKRGVQKNHGYYTTQIIRQLAPSTSIIAIPVLDDQGYADKREVYDALVYAKKQHPDIVHLGFQILDFDLSQKLDRQIYKILKQFTCVIVPAGNNIAHHNFPPQLPQVCTVASFCTKNNRYPISSFSAQNVIADFIMPGEDIDLMVQIDNQQPPEIHTVSGTSFASAVMTGCTAILFEKNHKNMKKVISDLQKSAVILDPSWQNKIRWGLPKIG